MCREKLEIEGAVGRGFSQLTHALVRMQIGDRGLGMQAGVVPRLLKLQPGVVTWDAGWCCDSFSL